MKRLGQHNRKRQGSGERQRRLLPLAAAAALSLLMQAPQPAMAQCAPPSEGLIGHWTLDESSGTFADSSVNNNGGTATNGVTYAVAGTVGNAAGFDGVDDYINIAGTTVYANTGSPFTVSAWVKSSALSGSFDNIVTLRSNGSEPFEIGLGANGSGFNGIYMGANSGFVGMDLDTAPPTDGNWHHVLAVYNGNGAGTIANYKLYLDGVSRTLTASTVFAATAQKSYIGENGGGEWFTGSIDDVRVYNRALAESEIAALYALRSTADAPAGFMTYDVKSAAMIYCNGTDWVHAGIGSYNPNAVNFNGSSDLQLTTPTLPQNSKAISGSAWVRKSATGTTMHIYSDGNYDFGIQIDSSGNFSIGAYNDDANWILICGSDGTPITDTAWHHVLWSFDLSDTAKKHIYVDDVNRTPAGCATYVDDYFMHIADARVGSGTGGTDRWSGDIADLWQDFETYIDFSIEANRRKFRSPSGLPMYLGPDGSIPTGEAPDIFMSGATSDWHTNKGTGGGFTINGALTTAATQPGDALIGSGNVASGLLGYWPLNEGAGTTAADVSGNGHDGTVNGPVWQGSGILGSALIFDGTDDYVGIADALNFGTQLTLSAWFKTDTIASEQVIFGVFDGSNDPNYYSLLVDASWCTPMCFAGQTDTSPSWTSYAIASNTDIAAGQWYFGVMTVNGTELKLYLNGVLEDTVTVAANAAFSGTPEIGRSDTNWSWNWFDGAIDEVRVYDRVLTDDEVKLLYGCGVPPGTMKYDPAFHVMQYCNGSEWVAMGPVGGTPPASGLVGHWKMDETSGTTAVDSAGAFDFTLNNMSPPANWTLGKLDNALDLDGVDDDGVISGLMGQPQNATVAAWVNLDSTPDVSGADAFSVGDYIGVRLDENGTDSFGFYYTGSLWNRTGTADAFTGKGWRHVAYVIDDTNNVQKFYVDGVEVESTSFTESISYAGLDLDTTIGRNPGGGFRYDGRIDDLRLYDRALSGQEISQIYHYGLSGGLGDVVNACASPAADEGEMVYNTDHDYMQYCNGERWVAIGK